MAPNASNDAVESDIEVPTDTQAWIDRLESLCNLTERKRMVMTIKATSQEQADEIIASFGRYLLEQVPKIEDWSAAIASEHWNGYKSRNHKESN